MSAESRRRGATVREIGGYLLWQLPGWGLLALLLAWLIRVMDLGVWIAAAVFCLFVVKDLVLFPAMRAAFRPSPSGAWPIGERGEAVERLEPSGYIRVKGELWKAEAHGPGKRIPAGSTVVVRGARGLTLFVDEDAELAAGERWAPERWEGWKDSAVAPERLDDE